MTTSTSKTAATARKSRNELKVLVVDDDPFQLEFICDLLRGLGIQDIIAAENGNSALQSIARFKTHAPFDLMLSDLHMPGMDGFQFMASAAQQGFKGALIIVSGQGGDVMHSASLVAQLRRFNLLGSLPKPVDKTALSTLISKIA